MLINDDPSIQRFVIDHLFIVGGSAITIFGTGCAVGRFWFDRAVLSLRAAAEDFEHERDAAREQRDELKQQLEEKKKEPATLPDGPGAGFQEYNRGRRQAARARILSQLLAALVAMMLLGAAVYSVYELRALSLKCATEKALKEFQEESDQKFRELDEKLKPPTKPTVTTKLKNNKRTVDTSSPVPQK
jgi:hypothetical protein